MTNVGSVTAVITTSGANKGSSQYAPSTLALHIKGKAIAYAPSPRTSSDVSAALIKASAAGAGAAREDSAAFRIPLAVFIRAFRDQIGQSSPELLFRTWKLFVAFEEGGTAAAGATPSASSGGARRRALPPIPVPLPRDLMSETPMATPAASTDYTAQPITPTKGTNIDDADVSTCIDTACGPAAAIPTTPQRVNDPSRTTLAGLLGGLVGTARASMPTGSGAPSVWSARLLFVVGEGEDEARRRRAAMKAMATVTVAAGPQPRGGEEAAADEQQQQQYPFGTPFGMPQPQGDYSLFRQRVLEHQAHGTSMFGGGGFGTPLPPPPAGTTTLFGQAGQSLFSFGNLTSSMAPPNPPLFAAPPPFGGPALFAQPAQSLFGGGGNTTAPMLWGSNNTYTSFT